MKNNTFKSTAIMVLCIIIQSCGQQADQPQQEETNELIASKYGLELTEAHFEAYLRFVEQEAGETSNLQTQLAIKSQLKEAFLNNPGKILEELNGLEYGSGSIPKPELGSNPEPFDRPNPNLAEGHTIVRNVLGNDIGQMKFDTNAANTFRQYVANSVITSSSNSYNSSYDSNDYTSSNARYQFCANGTFIEALSGHVSIQVEGMEGNSSGTDYMPGYWEVAALPNGMMVILMYSTHPKMLKDFPNGLLPFIIAKHGVDFVALPSGDLYSRSANQYCN